MTYYGRQRPLVPPIPIRIADATTGETTVYPSLSAAAEALGISRRAVAHRCAAQIAEHKRDRQKQIEQAALDWMAETYPFTQTAQYRAALDASRSVQPSDALPASLAARVLPELPPEFEAGIFPDEPPASLAARIGPFGAEPGRRRRCSTDPQARARVRELDSRLDFNPQTPAGHDSGT
jgi:hypothetical protein